VDQHPDTHFLPAHEVEAMKRVVEQARPSGDANSRPSLPDDTLDDCEKAFVAAQSHIAKANSAIFADTALMALLCHHDRPLFLVNMTSPGERQYYALALIKAIYQHLPGDWTVGVLYDIACQLERSMRKVRVPYTATVPDLNQVLVWLLTQIHRSNDVRSLRVSCIRPSVGVSACLPSSEMQRLWAFGWGGL